MKKLTMSSPQFKKSIHQFRVNLKTKRRNFKKKIRTIIFGNSDSKKEIKRKKEATNELIKIINNQHCLEYYKWAHPSFKESSKKRFIWFVPDWSNVWGGGHYTLFRFANHFSSKDGGVENIIFIYNYSTSRTVKEIEKELKSAIKNCKLKVIVKPQMLPECDAAFATTWQSAYDVKAFPYAKKKFYFMQDYESLFYAYGTNSMQAINSYKMGFYGITGGTWLRKIYESYGGIAENYIFSVDKDIFYPSNNGKVRDKVSKVFFYGRHSTERRCFELGILSLKIIAQNYPDVEIVIAGLKIEQEVLPFKATLLGNISLAETGKLYRTCDIGIAFSGTNLSYLPVELMASGCPLITNNGEQTEWYCNSENSIIADPTPLSIYESFKKLYDSKELRQKLVNSGLKKTECTSWEAEMDKIYDYIKRITF